MVSSSADFPLILINQILDSVEIIKSRSEGFTSGDEYLLTFQGKMTLDSICMQFIALGESLKRFDRATNGQILSQYPEVSWKGFMGFRDIVAHKYFDIDADQIHWIIANDLIPLQSTLSRIKTDLLSDNQL